MSFACHPEGARRAVARGIRRLGLLALPTLLCSAAPSSLAAPAHPRVENVLVVTLDGLRWQELFSGFDATFRDEVTRGEDGAYRISRKETGRR